MPAGKELSLLLTCLGSKIFNVANSCAKRIFLGNLLSGSDGHLGGFEPGSGWLAQDYRVERRSSRQQGTIVAAWQEDADPAQLCPGRRTRFETAWQKNTLLLADRVGFEPTVSFHPRRFSRPLP
jgi:hypothetical protein